MHPNRWADPNATLTGKQASFFYLVEKLTNLVESEIKMDSLMNLILMVCLLRVIHCTK